MRNLQLIRLSAFTLLLFMYYPSFGQKNSGAANETTWKKRVERIVELHEEYREQKNHLKDVSSNETLLRMLNAAIKSGKVTAYSNWDNQFTTKLTPDKFPGLIDDEVRVEEVQDPVTGEMRKVERRREFRPEAIFKYRTLEDWVFNPITGKTEIQIVGIAPIQDIYGDDGVFRGVQALYWVKYNDVQSIIIHHAETHPTNSLPLRIWEDYFLKEEKPREQKK